MLHEYVDGVKENKKDFISWAVVSFIKAVGPASSTTKGMIGGATTPKQLLAYMKHNMRMMAKDYLNGSGQPQIQQTPTWTSFHPFSE